MTKTYSNLMWLLAAFTIALTACAPQNTGVTTSGTVTGTIVQAASVNGGLLQNLYTDKGQTVTQGQVIAVIDTLALHYQMQELDAGLTELTAQLQVQQQQIVKANSSLSWLTQKQHRTSILVQKSGVAQQNLDDLNQQVQSAQATKAIAVGQLQVIKAKQQQLVAKQSQLRKKIADCIIKAPLGGVIDKLYYQQKEAVPPLAPVVEIVRLDEMETTIYVGADTLPQIKAGQKVAVNGQGLAKPISGVISWISPQAEFTPNQVLTDETRAALVYAINITIPNPEGLLKHGMAVQVNR